MITIESTAKTAEMAKIEISDSELSKTCDELCRMARFAHEVSEAADRIEGDCYSLQEKERDKDRASCEMDKNLADCGMHIKDGFFRIKAGNK